MPEVPVDLPGIPDAVRASAFEAKHMLHEQLWRMGYRNQLLVRTLSFPGVMGATVFVSVYDWSGQPEQWDELQEYALSHGFCVERIRH